MSRTNAYQALLADVRETALLSSTAALLAWDQETGMPAGAGERRAEQLSLLAGMVHQRSTSECIGDQLEALEASSDLDDAQQACVRELRRDYDRATRLPAALVTELAATESRAQQAWAKARADSDFPAFAPLLERMVELQRQKADCLRDDSATGRWDALAELYEPEMKAAELRALFLPLRQRLVELRQGLEAGERPADTFKRRRVAKQSQQAFVRAVIDQMGFDAMRGRIDESTHPFCSGVGGSCDVRLTTRFGDDDVLDALGSTMHEGGHGLYEQGLPAEPFGTPLCEAVSLGIHESQSRLWENHVGRSLSFWRWVWPLAERHLGAACDGLDGDEVFRQANVVTPSLIRVEADEATYDLHVMVRFELEQALIDGDLAIADLPARWNALYRDYLGVEVPDDRRGCLQDVHWSCGLFGYFPTYTLGNLYAAQFAAAMQAQLGGLDDAIERGDFAPLREWLHQHVHRHGRRHRPAELCRMATGRELTSEPFLQHLETKLRRVYRL